MAGHSKWVNIKHRKGAQDAKRAKLFAKFSKEIMVAAASGGGDPDMNSALRLAISKAKAQSMPKKNIETAISKATGSGTVNNYKEMVYGGNVSGVSFLVVCLSDNVNRVASTIQFLFNKVNGTVSGSSSVSYIFDRKGVLEFEIPSNITEEEIMMISLESGADDFQTFENKVVIYTSPSSFSSVKDSIEKKGITEFTTAEVKYIPNQEVKLPKEKAERILEFIDKLEDDDDIQEVFHNLDEDSLN